MNMKTDRPERPVHPFADEKLAEGTEFIVAPSPTVKKDGTQKRAYKKKGVVASYKRKGVTYGTSKPTSTMKVHAVTRDKRMLDEASRSPLHRTKSSKLTTYTLVPADYKPTTLSIPVHLARQTHLQPEQEPEQTPQQDYHESQLPHLAPVDPKCYKVEFPSAMKTDQSAQEAAAHDYYLTHTAASREAARHTEAKRTEEALTVMAAPINHLQPNDIAIMRSQVFATVQSQTQKVVGVLNGTETWNPQQVRLYGMMLNKVLPDLHHSYSEVAVQDSDVNKLSRKELEDIIASSSNTNAAQDIVEENYRPSFNSDPHPEPIGPVIITQTKQPKQPKA